uniref:Copia protein n=1 Tax=Tanacetum cinerariifolium TaxID=118510 RepID=A0A699HW55_TANCI|nr:copia protein [Tanacetum cinerariifolium]GEY70292.1 copia protein [Tanacetum cinerariifolium]
MKNEIKALEANNTWELTFLPSSKQPIKCKFDFKIKYNANGTVERYKARLVAKECSQTEGIDFTKTFAPVAKMAIKTKLHNQFSIKDLRQLHYYLGIEFIRGPKGIMMTQRKYAMHLIEHAGLMNAKYAKTPLNPNVKLQYEDGEPLSDPSQYMTLVGKLIYLTINRPDIAFAA